uniref:Uncharacterized protein n=1 Tax=Arundo donax TaxID=35708 RepID=A0A0A9C7Z0_ARUDO
MAKCFSFPFSQNLEQSRRY